MYTTLKAVHVTAVVLSGSGFLLRYLLRIAQVPAARDAFWRALPHVIDTVLLASAISLAFIGRYNPLTTPWLAAKIIALIVYIVVGAAALKGPPARRAPAFIVAAAAFAYIVSVALTKNPLGPLTWITA